MENPVIAHIEIPVTDLDKAKEFYQQLFDWNFKEFGKGYLLCKSDKGMTKGLRKVEKIVKGDCTIFHIKVDKIDSYLEKVKGIGGDIARQKTVIPVYGYYALVSDPDGNTIGLYQHN